MRRLRQTEGLLRNRKDKKKKKKIPSAGASAWVCCWCCTSPNGRSNFILSEFLARLPFEPTSCQRSLLGKVADFVSSDDSDILVVNGYAGTGKTTAISSVISVMKEFQTKCVLLAPTGRAAKVLSSYSGQPAFTIHKHIYRQKSVGGDGFG